VENQKKNILCALKNLDLIVNATSVGLRRKKLDFFPLENIKASALIFDMIYSRVESPLMHTCQGLGVHAFDGPGRLVILNVKFSYFLRTGRNPATTKMCSCLEHYLQIDKMLSEGAQSQ